MNENAFILDNKQIFFLIKRNIKPIVTKLKSIKFFQKQKINKITYIFLKIGHCDDFRCDHDIFLFGFDDSFQN